MFVLFLAMNGEVGELKPLFIIMPFMRIFFVLYMVLCSWAILSILTAVVSDKMIAVAQKSKEDQEQAHEEALSLANKTHLRTILSASYRDENGHICQEEFEELL